jgi:PLP dependent protein
MSDIIENWKRVLERVEDTAVRAGRDPSEIKIIAVSKTKPVAILQEAVQAGATILGENRVQEAWQKYEELGKIASWHLVGHLQTNKVRRALQVFDVIHSVDSVHLAEEINRRCDQLNRNVEILVEVKTSDEASKFGIKPEDSVELVEKISNLSNLKLIGLMTLGKWTTNEAEVRNCFQLLVKVKEEIESANIANISLKHLSMGMSGDFEWAIEEGATMVRIGTAIFGARNYKI